MSSKLMMDKWGFIWSPETEKYKDLFMKHLKNFLFQLHNKFPEDRFLEISAKGIVATSETRIIKEFGQHIMLYKDKIEEADDDFFISTDFSDHWVEDESDVTLEEFHFKMDYIKGIWISKGITREDKKIIWKYLMGFINIYEKYAVARDKAKEKIEILDYIDRRRSRN